MFCRTHRPCPVDITAPEPDPLGLRHITLTWDVHTDTDNVHILSYPCADCPAWITQCQLCGVVSQITTPAGANHRPAALSAATSHGNASHMDGCGKAACASCQAAWLSAAQEAKADA